MRAEEQTPMDIPPPADHTVDAPEKPNVRHSIKALCFGTTVVPVDSQGALSKTSEREETSLTFFLEALFPFLLAGTGMVGAGLLFDASQSWTFFTNVPEAVILVPALLGLKGNLEMTLASRLGTQANLGQMSTREQQLKITCSNLALVQAQAIIVSLAAASVTVLCESARTQTWDTGSVVLLCLTSVATASLTSLVLGLIMIGVVIFSMRVGINPDNITTPIAASLGDMTTLFIMIGIGTLLIDLLSNVLFNSIVLAVWSCSALFFIWLASRDESAANVLKHGWYAIIAAMFISSGGGLILQTTVVAFPGVAPFQPVINGVGGNLVAIQASRLSTSLHKAGKVGVLPERSLRKYLSVIRAFLSRDTDSRAARILLLMAVPGHSLFITLIVVSGANVVVSLSFVVAYLIVSLIQVFLLLYLCQFMVRVMWRFHVDPDNNAIPVLTALGDLLGIILLAAAFVCLQEWQSGTLDAALAMSLHNETLSTFLDV